MIKQTMVKQNQPVTSSTKTKPLESKHNVLLTTLVKRKIMTDLRQCHEHVQFELLQIHVSLNE